MNQTNSVLQAFVRFLVIGTACYAINLGMLWVAVERAGMHYMVASILCMVPMLIIGHYLNRVHAFRSNGGYSTELLRFAFARLSQIGIGLGAIALLVEFAGIQYLVANVLVTAAVTIASFLVHRRYVFLGARNPRAPL